MTITAEDHARFASTVETFHAQAEHNTCLQTCIKNVLDDLASNTGNTDLQHSISDISAQLDFHHLAGPQTDQLATRLDPLTESAGYESTILSGGDFHLLDTVIEDDERSLPICEFNPQYWEDIPEYSDVGIPEPGINQYGNLHHTVIPIKINSDSILFFDPYLHFFHESIDITEEGGITVPKMAFNEWWSKPEKRWTLWFEPTAQLELPT